MSGFGNHSATDSGQRVAGYMAEARERLAFVLAHSGDDSMVYLLFLPGLRAAADLVAYRRRLMAEEMHDGPGGTLPSG